MNTVIWVIIILAALALVGWLLWSKQKKNGNKPATPMKTSDDYSTPGDKTRG